MLRELTKQGLRDGSTRRMRELEAIDREAHEGRPSSREKSRSMSLPAWPPQRQGPSTTVKREARANNRPASPGAASDDMVGPVAPIRHSGQGTDSALELLRRALQSRPLPDSTVRTSEATAEQKLSANKDQQG